MSWIVIRIGSKYPGKQAVAIHAKAFGLMAVGDQPCDQIDQEVDGTAMPGMLDLIYIFELISDGFDEGSCTEEDNGHDSE